MAEKSRQSASKRAAGRSKGAAKNSNRNTTAKHRLAAQDRFGDERMNEPALGRWAIIRTMEEGDDLTRTGREEVINICIMNPPGVPPEVNVEAEGDDENAEKYTTEQVAEGVMIGMVRGGPVDAVGGFGFPEGSVGRGDRYGPGVTRLADVGAR